MFEFHGWAVLCWADSAADPGQESAIRVALEAARSELSVADVATSGNDLTVVYIHGLRNHAAPTVVRLFEVIAKNARDPYGLLYIRDQEDHRGSGYDDSFRVWRLAHGQLSEMGDPFLSPCVPTIERPYDRASEK